MKLIFKNLALLFLILVLTTSETTVKESRLIGTWKLVSGKSNGVATPKVIADRNQVFRIDKTFESLVNTPNGQMHGNGGLYFLPNDTTVITFHKESNGKLSTIANTYFFRIKNDSLHLYGNYLAGIKENPALLQKVFIDERWVRIKSK